MPSITRRRALATVGGIGALSVGALGVESFAGPAPTFDEWAPADGDWPASRRDSRRTAAAPDATPPDVAPNVDWEVETPRASALVVADNTAYVGGQDGVAAVDLEDGTELWTDDPVGETLCHRGNVLYCGDSRTGTLTALNSDTGDQRFEIEEPFYRVWDLLALEDVLLVGDHGALRGCDPATGAVEWERNIGGSGEMVPAVADERLYVGGPGPLETYRPHEGWDAIRHDGPQQLERGIGPSFASAPAVDDEGVYLGGDGMSRETAAFGFDCDGRQIWEGPSGHRLSSPALADDIGVLAASNRDESAYRLLGVGLTDGSTIWSEPSETAPVDLVVAGGLAIVGRHDGALFALEPETGDSVWEITLDDRIEAVVPSGDRVLVASDQGGLSCLR